VRAVLTFVVPVAFLTTVPAEAAAGTLTWGWALAALAMAVAAARAVAGAVALRAGELHLGVVVRPW
jgi:ABC-type uncharacterized transport system permease subunit